MITLDNRGTTIMLRSGPSLELRRKPRVAGGIWKWANGSQLAGFKLVSLHSRWTRVLEWRGEERQGDRGQSQVWVAVCGSGDH